MALTRKQIYLDAESDRRLKKLSRTTRLSEAEHIRRALRRYLGAADSESYGTDQKDPLLDLIGVCKGRPKHPDAALNHDKYLYKADS